ncbi:predicted protein [Paecilomyces variotii No. 5]|uniref:AT hook motif protein n=1 Tax=Byssochlamys spectabilis (strain No. 5 / NBRC 109023) TaxID=1356009 RepID=V5G5V3_BYSSN|nr:predicted protein [Paecilomyces variotii No. 5]
MFSRASNVFAAAVAPAVEQPTAGQIRASGDDARDASTAIALEQTETDLTGVAVGDIDTNDLSHQMVFDVHATTNHFELSAPEDGQPQEDQAARDESAAAGEGLVNATSEMNGEDANSAAQSRKRNEKAEERNGQVLTGSTDEKPALATPPPATEKPAMDATATPSRRSQRAASQLATPVAPSSAKKQTTSTENANEPTTGDKRKRGRPSKTAEEGDNEQTTKRSKTTETGTPRGRGRPPNTGTKSTSASAKKPTSTPGRGRGRPRKPESERKPPKPVSLNPDGTPRGRGRPRKSDGAVTKQTTTPSKAKSAAANGTPGSRGRPRKSDAAATASAAKSPGRPKKAAAPELKKGATANDIQKRRGRPRKSG